MVEVVCVFMGLAIGGAFGFILCALIVGGKG